VPDSTEISYALTNLGNLYRLTAATGDAETTLRRAVEMTNRSRVPHSQANTLAQLGGLLADTGRETEGERMLRDALATYKDIDLSMHTDAAIASVEFGQDSGAPFRIRRSNSASDRRERRVSSLARRRPFHHP